MIKNDYRRDMILLRPLEDGISGFCRLEARVSRGSITYNIRAQRSFGGRLMAVLAGVRNGRWQAALGGEIRADALGQAGYYWEFDPRAINSLALENYALIGVAVDGPDARLLLAGKQDKGCIIDWEAAERAVHELLAPAGSDAKRATELLAPADSDEKCVPENGMGGADAADAGRTVRSSPQVVTIATAADDIPSSNDVSQTQTSSNSVVDDVQSSKDEPQAQISSNSIVNDIQSSNDLLQAQISPNSIVDDIQSSNDTPQTQTSQNSTADANLSGNTHASSGGNAGADGHYARQDSANSADMTASCCQAADEYEHCQQSENAQRTVDAQPAPRGTSCGMRFEMCGDGGAQDRSRMIRVLGASIAGEKDCELDDDALERVIAQALRGVMGQLGLNGEESTAQQDSDASNDSFASRNNTMPQDNTASKGNAMPKDNAAPQGNTMPQNNAASQGSAMPRDNTASQGNTMPQDNAASQYTPYTSTDAAISEADEARIAEALLEEQERERADDMMQSGAIQKNMDYEPETTMPHMHQGDDKQETTTPRASQYNENAYNDAQMQGQSAASGVDAACDTSVPNDTYASNDTYAPNDTSLPNDTYAPNATSMPNDTSAVEPWLLDGLCAQERTWPECCAELKPLFCQAVRACPLDEPGFVFVRAPMAGGGSCAVGIKCEGGLPAEVMYLIPGRYAAVPPAGLEGYVWREGEGGGFWAARQDAYTGAMLFEQ